MKPIRASSAAFVLCCCVWASQASAQQAPATSKSSTPAPKTSGATSQGSAQDKNTPVAELLVQGKAFFRVAKLRQALTKFEAALKQEPENDEALGLAAETAFRLDSQTAARDYWMRRADVPSQKDSVKAFCLQRVAMTYWREAHDLVAKAGEIKQGKVVYDLPEESFNQAMDAIHNGIEYANRAIGIRDNFADAYNVRNLLHAEAALAATDEEHAKEYRQKSLEDLKMALVMARPVPDNKTDAADLNYPTLRISEFARTKTEDGQIEDPMLKAIEGGNVLKRVPAVFPSVRSSKPTNDPKDPSAKGVTPDGGAYSLGTGRGALTAAYAAGKVKVEVLISTDGKVIFTHIVDGRSDLNGAAVLAARGWTFEPALLDGQLVQISGVISFDLRPGGTKAASPPAAKAPPKKP